jgi:hypothetical protein
VGDGDAAELKELLQRLDSRVLARLRANLDQTRAQLIGCPAGIASDPTTIFSSRCLLLTGENRRKAILGTMPLSQLESSSARSIPQERSLASTISEIEVFRSRRDDAVMATMDLHGESLSHLRAGPGRGDVEDWLVVDIP